MKKTDLAVESAQLAAGLPGVRSVSRNIGGVKICLLYTSPSPRDCR